jgi:Helix-turn-helix domain
VVTDQPAPFVLSIRAQVRLAPAVRLLAARARRDGYELDPELAELLAACEAAERAYQRRPGGVRRSSLAPAASALPGSAVLTAAQAARAARVSERAVQAAAAAGRLAGRRGGDGRWRFEVAEVERWSSSRRRRSA